MNAPDRPAARFQPRGLVSLWDMLEIDAWEFVTTIQSLATMEFALGQKDSIAKNGKQKINDEEAREMVLSSLEAFIRSCYALSANNSVAKAQRVRKRIIDRECTYKELRMAIIDMRDRFRDELESVKLFGMNERESVFFDSSPSERVAEAFPSACFDLEEAGKCMALNRSTAAVLHLMRALEHPLQAMAKAVDEIPKENWNTILNDIEKKVRGKDDEGKRTEYWRGRKRSNPFSPNAATHFFHVKNAWRNHCSHAVKLKYTEEDARNIYISVASFFEHLSARLRENNTESRAPKTE